MKNVLIGLLALTSVSAFAGILGTPDQDPVVRSIQKSFANAKSPTEADLRLGHKWVCKMFVSTKDSYSVIDADAEYIFQTFDGLITNSGSSKAKYFVYESTGIVGTDLYDKDGSVIEVRVNSKGDLISEYSMPRSSLGRYSAYSQSTIIAQAIHDPSFVAIYYTVCPKK